jgi:hypothetical protein
MQPMQPMQPMQQQPPQKKGMSGCAIAALVVGGIFALFVIAGIVIAVFVVHKVGQVVGDAQAAVKAAQNAPGAAELRSAGCNQAMVLDVASFVKSMTKDIPGANASQIDAGTGLLVQCQIASGEGMTCAQVAKTYVSAPGHEAEPFTATVADMQGNEKCARDFDANGKEIGAASRHVNTSGAQ